MFEIKFSPTLQRLHRWNLGMHEWFHLTLYNGCNYLSMLRLFLFHVNINGPWSHSAYQIRVKHVECLGVDAYFVAFNWGFVFKVAIIYRRHYALGFTRPWHIKSGKKLAENAKALIPITGDIFMEVRPCDIHTWSLIIMEVLIWPCEIVVSFFIVYHC